MEELEKELEKVHKDYEKRKERIIMNLETIRDNLYADDTIPELYSTWIQVAIDFIKEKEK